MTENKVSDKCSDTVADKARKLLNDAKRALLADMEKLERKEEIIVLKAGIEKSKAITARFEAELAILEKEEENK